MDTLPQRKVREMIIRRFNGPETLEEKDFLAAEDPLEIRVEGRSVAVVMRTPGDDRELAAGFLVTEGLVRKAGDLKAIRHQAHCLSLAPKNEQRTGRPSKVGSAKLTILNRKEPIPTDGNVINVQLRNPKSVDFKKLTRHVFTSSSCGICSKASITAVQQQFLQLKDASQVEAQVIMGLPQALAQAQETFKQTGGLHACALFDLTGTLLVVREDVGRHNALDKVIGWALLTDRLPLQGHILLLSGRTSFEMMQKALAGGIAIIAAVSAPSSLAVEFARDSGQTLVGFLRGNKMNVYAGAGRILADGSELDK
ncbi:MAG TPA: formate dehydrogenase accessory sulfurtransferase FdhD [Verrucomicrobiae bacterium]|nr:formate dehydrogenase accessory sulfurtransferase FdhD [Verrucomicrobiae bacterium]